MAQLIECECCNKKISEDATTCIHCGHHINVAESTLLFSYEYNDEVLNTKLYKEEVYKLDVLQKVKKVKLDNDIYRITDFICDASNETVHIILDDI